MKKCRECGAYKIMSVDKSTYYLNTCIHGRFDDVFCDQECSESCYFKNNIVAVSDIKEVPLIVIISSVIGVIAIIVLGIIIFCQNT